MSRLTVITSIAISTLATASTLADTSRPIILVDKPTVIAFFPATLAEVDRNPDTAEAIDDFNLSVSQVRGRLTKAGITIQTVNASSFRVQISGKILSFPNSKRQSGYYFIAPGKAPRIEYDVVTGDDLLEIARKYFGIAIP